MDNRHRLNILLADDDEQNHELMRFLIQREGHRLKTVWNGMEAVQAIRQGQYNMVLLDAQMPLLDGAEAARAIRSEKGVASLVPIVILSAHASPAEQTKFKAAGANTCLTKPVDVQKLHILLKIVAEAPYSTRLTNTCTEGRIGTELSAGDLPVIDYISALPRFGNDQKVYMENLSVFLGKLPGRLENFREFYVLQQWYELKLGSHNLMGLSANFGAMQLAYQCSRLEISCESGLNSNAGSILAEVQKSAETLIDTSATHFK